MVESRGVGVEAFLTGGGGGAEHAATYHTCSIGSRNSTTLSQAHAVHAAHGRKRKRRSEPRANRKKESPRSEKCPSSSHGCSMFRTHARSLTFHGARSLLYTSGSTPPGLFFLIFGISVKAQRPSFT